MSRADLGGEAAGAGADLGWVVDRIPAVVSRLSIGGEILYVSANTRELYGREPEELIGTSAFDMLADPLERAGSLRRLEQLTAEEGRETQITLAVDTSDGESISVDIVTRSVRNPRTGELEIVAVTREATERLEVAEALATAEARFRELVEWLPAVVYEAETGPDGAFYYVSPQITELLGYSPDEWMADPTLWRRRLHAEETDQVLELERIQEREAREQGARLGSEYRMTHRSGRTVWVRDVARLCTTEDGPSFWRGVLTDITAERNAQLSLADAHERHRNMVEGLPACVYQAERRAMGRWHFVSSQIERLLGYTADDWRADPTLWRASLHADDRERVEFDEQRHLESPPGTELVSEYRLRHRTGRPVWVRDRAVLSVDGSGEQMIDGILTDITAERAAEAGAEGRADVYRLTCNDCGATWPATGVEHCRACQSRNVEGVSLNATLHDLAASRQQVEGLLDGIQRHLEALGTNLRTTAAPVSEGADERGSGGGN